MKVSKLFPYIEKRRKEKNTKLQAHKLNLDLLKKMTTMINVMDHHVESNCLINGSMVSDAK